MTPVSRTPARASLLEWAGMLAVLASVAWSAWWFHAYGYLPQPFVFDTNDTFMDWFNTAYWAHHPGAYETWNSIYPPLSFVFLRFAGLAGCYVSSPFAARDCDWLGRVVILACYAIDVMVAWLAFRRANRASAIPRTVAFGLGLPLLFSLERGNLILPCFIAFALAHGRVLRAPWANALAEALTINFKPYLLLPVLAHGLRRQWRALEWAGLATIAVYCLTLAVVGSGTVGQLVDNTTQWVVFVGGQVWNEINYSTSYAPLLMLRQSGVPLLEFLPSRVIEGVEMAVPLAIRSTQVVALACLAAAAWRPSALPNARSAAVLLGGYLVTQSPGGYTQVFLLFLVLLEPWERLGPRLAICLTYALLLVGDRLVAPILTVQSASWLSHRPVSPEFGITMGHLLRPGLIILIVWALSLDGIAQVLRPAARS